MRVLKQRDARTATDGRGNGEATGHTGGAIADDVPEQVAAHQHVKRLRATHKLHTEGVDDHVVVGQIGVLGRHRVADG